MTLGLVPGTEPADRFVSALRSGEADEARRIAVEEAPAYELNHFVVEPLVAKLESLPGRFMAGQEASRKLARMLLKDLVDGMFDGDVSTGGHQGPDGRWYVFKGLSPELVEVSGSVIETVDKARFLDWLAPIEALLIRHLSGRLSREALLQALRRPKLVKAATYPHRALQQAATAGTATAPKDGVEVRAARNGMWNPQADPDLQVCFSGEHGYIVLGGGQSHLVDQVYQEAVRVVRQMSQRELLDIARRVPGEMLQPDYPNFIRNVLAKVTPILGLPPDNRTEIREDLAAGGRDNLLLMLALSRARYSGWLDDTVVEEIYALREKNRVAGEDPQGIDAHRELVARLMDRPDDRRFLQTLDPAAARILLNDAIQLLQHQRARSAFAAPADRVRRGLALLKLLSLHGVLDGFIIAPFAGRYFFPAQFGRLAALNETALGSEVSSDRQSFLDEIAAESEVYQRAGLHTGRIQANLVTQRVPGLITHAAAIAERALQSALQEMPGKPVTLLFHLREWIRTDPASPVWARDLDQACSRILAPWAAVLRPGDYVVLLEGDAAFKGRLLADASFEELDLGVAPPDVDRQPDAVRPALGSASRRLLSSFDMPSSAVVLRKLTPG